MESHKRRKNHHDTLDNSRLDSGILFQIKKYLRKEHQIPSDQIKIDHAVRITRGGCKLLGRLRREEISQACGIIHTPDITVTDKGGKPLFIIEQDGRIHESERQMKKDKARKRHYAYAGIPCIVLNTKEIGATGMIPATYLDKELEGIGMVKPAGLNPHFFLAAAELSGRCSIGPYRAAARLCGRPALGRPDSVCCYAA